MSNDKLCYAHYVFSEVASRSEQESSHRDDPLSSEFGFIVTTPPVTSFPTSHQVWDDVAQALPAWVGKGTQRAELEKIPLLSAAVDSLPQEYVCRAITLISHLAHAYYMGDMLNGEKPCKELPDNLELPWQVLSERLNRLRVGMTGFESVLYNWKLRDPNAKNPRRLENMDLLIPFYGNQEERMFNLSFLEVSIASAPLLALCIKAQDAVVNQDMDWLKDIFIEMIPHINQLTQALLKLEPMVDSCNYLNPVIWAKTAPNVSASMRESEAGLSGGSAPFLHLLDIFLGREGYSTEMGVQAIERRFWMPRGHIEFLSALNSISVRDFVVESRDNSLIDLFNQIYETYTGKDGFLGIHRRKIFTYMELGFKAGRLQTNAGSQRDTDTPPWEVVDKDLEDGRLERYIDRIPKIQTGIIEKNYRFNGALVHVDISVPDGVVYLPGDRCSVYIENDRALVKKTLDALGANEDSLIKISHEWQDFFRKNNPALFDKIILLKDFLRYAKIRPLSRDTAIMLYQLTHSRVIKDIIDHHTHDQFEFWDFIKLISSFYNPKKLWKIAPWQRENLSRLLPPDNPRSYSISSSAYDQKRGNFYSKTLSLDLTHLSYATNVKDEERKRYGTASSFLAAPENVGKKVRIKIERSPFYEYLHACSQPLFLFANGAGLSSILSLLKYLDHHPSPYVPQFFYGCRDYAHLAHKEYLLDLARRKKIELHLSFSRIIETDIDASDFDELKRSGVKMIFGDYVNMLMLDKEARDLINKHMLLPVDDEQAGYIYICGRTGFSRTVMEALETVLSTKEHPDSKAILDRLIAEKRLQADLFTEHMSSQKNTDHSVRYIPVSEVIEHNNPRTGFWMIISGIVYDITSYIKQHPGGDKILTASCGLDATRAYRNVEHHLWPSIEAVLKGYQIGLVEVFEGHSGTTVSIHDGKAAIISEKDVYERWSQAAYALVEMQNTLFNAYSIPYEGSDLNCKIIFDIHKLIFGEFLHAYLKKHLEPLFHMTAALYDEGRLIGEVHERFVSLGKLVVTPPSSLEEVSADANSFDATIHNIITADQAFFSTAKSILHNGLLALEENKEVSMLPKYLDMLLGDIELYINEMKKTYRVV